MGGEVCIFQVGELHLNQPLAPIQGLPADLRSTVVGGRFSAVESAFDLAIRVRAGLVLILESPCSLREDPLAAWFLMNQFDRLRTAGIEVVWGGCSHADLPEWMTPPAGLHFLPDRHSIGFRLAGTARTVEIEWANLTGDQQAAGQTGDIGIRLCRSEDGLWLESAIRGRPDPVRYLAKETTSGKRTIPDRVGCWLTRWLPEGEPVVQFIETGTILRIGETVAVEESYDWSTLRSRMRSRMEAHAQTPDADLVVVDWTLTGCGPLWDELCALGAEIRIRDEVRNPRILGPAAVVSGNMAFHPSLDQWRTWEADDVVRTGLTEGRALLQERHQRERQPGDLPTTSPDLHTMPLGAFERSLVWWLRRRPNAA